MPRVCQGTEGTSIRYSNTERQRNSINSVHSEPDNTTHQEESFLIRLLCTKQNIKTLTISCDFSSTEKM